MSFITNQIIKRNKKIESIYIYIIYIYNIYIYIYGYLINCEYFNNLKEDEDMAGTSIMAGICTSHPHTQLKKIGDSSYPYPYPVNVGISHQNGDGFGQYPRNGFICHL